MEFHDFQRHRLTIYFNTEENAMIVSFFGHSLINEQCLIKQKIKEKLITLYAKEGNLTCFVGGYGDFDRICAEVCRELKKSRYVIDRIYITPYMDLYAQKKQANMFDEGLSDSSLYPPLEEVPAKYAISKRNEWMVCNSDVIIAYVKHSWGGAYKTLLMAKRKNKEVINIGDLNIY